MRTTSAAAAAALALAASSAPSAAAAAEAELFFDGARVEDVLEALYGECYEAGMSAQTVGEQIIMCSANLTGSERLLEGVAIVNVHEGHVRHRIRFALAERAAGVQTWAYTWIEVEEPDGHVLEEDITSAEYLRRVRDVLDGISAALSGGATTQAPPWAQRYDTQDEWRLDAHIRAVAHCDANLADLTPERLEGQIAAVELRPFGRDLRSRCEELYEEVFKWGLAMGLDAPTVEAYAEHRAALPAEERTCPGRLALAAACR
jgi:hypothetical protein